MSAEDAIGKLLADNGWKPGPHEHDYFAPFQIAMRRAPGASVCIDPDCDLSGGAAHAGWCEACTCGKEHAVVECPERWCFTCEASKAERRVYETDTQRSRVEWYCYNCENTALWRLGRSVGK